VRPKSPGGLLWATFVDFRCEVPFLSMRPIPDVLKTGQAPDRDGEQIFAEIDA
jgi:hypothetical protein